MQATFTIHFLAQSSNPDTNTQEISLQEGDFPTEWRFPSWREISLLDRGFPSGDRFPSRSRFPSRTPNPIQTLKFQQTLKQPQTSNTKLLFPQAPKQGFFFEDALLQLIIQALTLSCRTHQGQDWDSSVSFSFRASQCSSSLVGGFVLAGDFNDLGAV